MNRFFIISFVSITLLGASLLWAAEAEGPPLESVERLERIEWRSVVTLQGDRLFGLHDRESRQTFWLQQGQRTAGFEVLAHDAERNLLTLGFGGAEREIELSRAPIRQAAEAAVLTAAERRERWRALQADLLALRGRWEAAAGQSPELREIEDHFRELGEELRDVMMGLAVAEEQSDDYRRLSEQRRELADEFRLLFRHSQNVVERHPGFAPGDAESLRRLQRLFPEELR